MSEYTEEIKSNLERAVSEVQSAREALATSQHDSAASHAAESAFHTANALLLNEKVEPGNQGDVITLIHQIFVIERRLTKEQGENLNWLFELRNAERRSRTTSEEVQKALQIAESFFEAAKVILES